MNTQPEFEADFDQNQFVTFRIAHLQNTLNAQAGRILKAHSDLTLTEWRILLLIKVWKMEHMADITRTATMDKGQVSRASKSLIEKGYIQSALDPSDARAQVLKVTAQGMALQKSLLPIMLRRQARLVRDISPEDMAVFARVLDSLEEGARIEDF